MSTDAGVHYWAIKTVLINIQALWAWCNVATMLQSFLTVIVLLIPFQDSWSSETASPQFAFSKQGSNHSHRISLILIFTFVKCLITLSVTASLRSRTAYRICIQFLVLIVLHPHKTLLPPLANLWLSLCVRFVHYINCAFSSDTKPATSLCGRSTWAGKNEWDMSPEHAFGCLWDEFKCSVNESGCFDDAK